MFIFHCSSLQPPSFTILTDSHGRYVQDGLITRHQTRVTFIPGGTTDSIQRIINNGHFKQGTNFILHVGTNNLTNKDGTEREDASTVIDKIVRLCVTAKAASTTSQVIFSSILPRVGDTCKTYNDRARYINRKARVILAGHQIGFLDHTRAFLRGKYNVEEHLFSKHDGLHLNLMGKNIFISSLAWVVNNFY